MGSSVIQSHAPSSLLEAWAPLVPGFDGAVATRTLLWSTPLTPYFLTGFHSGSLKHSLPPLSLSTSTAPILWFACSGNICWTELFLNQPFHVASVLRSVSFGWRLGEICSLRSVESFRYRGALLWAGCTPSCPRDFQPGEGWGMFPHTTTTTPSPKCLGRNECDFLIVIVQ